MDRNEDMIYSGNRHPYKGMYKVGYTSEGKLTALEMELYSNGGYSADESVPVSTLYTFLNDICNFCRLKS